MKALILCAGLGTRLWPLTKDLPKCMIEIDRRPVLEHLVFHLHKQGITEIIVNIHHKPEKIYQHFGNTLLYAYEPQLLGEEGAIDSIKHWLWQDYTVVMNGDTLTNIDIIEMFRWSQGKNIRSMDGLIYTGTKIISPQYFFGNKKFTNYYSVNLYWQDIGTKKGLEKARKDYEKITHLPKVRS